MWEDQTVTELSMTKAVRVGGRAHHSGLDVAFEVVQVLTARDGKWTRIDIYASKSEALEAVGLSR